MLKLTNQNIKNVLFYILSKLAGAGLLMVIFTFFIFVTSNMDMYRFVEGVSGVYLWLIAYGYGVISSILIDLFVRKFPTTSNAIIFLLYIIAGYAIFLFLQFNLIGFIAGTVGALCALLFYMGTEVSVRSKGFTYLFAFVLPLAIIILIQFDFTEKEYWSEVRENNSYSASFEYFNGEHEIPIEVKEGQTITLSYHFMSSNGGGYGYHVRDENDDYVGMKENNEDELSFTADKTGVYRVVVKGNDLQGSIKVNWKID